MLSAISARLFGRAESKKTKPLLDKGFVVERTGFEPVIPP